MFHVHKVRTRRPESTAAVVVTSLVLVLAAVTGFLAGSGSTTGVPIASAACSQAIGYCGLDATVTSALSVYHAKSEGQNVREVEPNTTDTWDIDATWSTVATDPNCPCTDLAAYGVAATVTWTDGVGWSVSCTGCNAVTGPIYRISVCNVGSCGATPDNGWAYKLIVDTKHTLPGQTCPGGSSAIAYLSSVDYTTTAVSDGNLVYTATCTEGAAVSPTSQTWSQTDYLPFDCSFDCSAGGPSVVIYYQ
jgi:hypothetical protein